MQQNEIPGKLPPFVVTRDGTLYSVRRLEGDDVDSPTILLVPSRQVRDLAEADYDWDECGVTCYPMTPGSLYNLLDSAGWWVAAHYYDEAWRLADMLTELSKEQEAPAA